MVHRDESFIPDLDAIESNYRKYLVKVCLIIGLPVLGFYAVYDLAIGRYLVGVIVLVMFLVLVGLFFIVRTDSYSHKEDIIYKNFVRILFFMLGFYIVYAIGIEGSLSRIPWSYLFPVVAFFALGQRSALMWALALYFALICLELFYHQDGYVVSSDLKLRFYISFAMTIVASSFFERLKRSYQERLISNQQSLMDSEKRSRDSYEELRHEMQQRKRIEQTLKESEEKHRHLIENANDAIFIAQDGVLKFSNPRTLALIGYSEDELVKIPFTELVHPEDRDMVVERHLKRLAGENPPSTYSFRVITKDGEELSVEINSVLFTWEGRPATLNFLRDVTEKKQLEARLQQAQKMEAVGTLAGGIAHDFNNLLMAIQGNASLMLLDTDSSHPHYAKLKSIEGQVKSGAELSGQLLGYARKGRYDVKTLAINEIVEDISNTFCRTRKEITLQVELAENLLPVEADKGQIEQVLLNLCVNAADAMPQAGKLVLETSNVSEKNMSGRIYNPKAGRYICLTVSDTGIGMDKKTKERIFEPFFTTKEMGRGTGLGLASVFGIVKAHGGYIDVESEIGRGSKFRVFLPASDESIRKTIEPPKRILNGSETILLVDDESVILDVGAKMLETLGYTVLVADSGMKAVDLYEENKDSIDMVIIDMVMPEMGGGEAFDKIKEINAKVKVLLSSGYSLDGQAQEILKRGCNGFIHKPFSLERLSEKIRNIIEGTQMQKDDPAALTCRKNPKLSMNSNPNLKLSSEQ